MLNWFRKHKFLFLLLGLVYVSYFLFQYKPHQTTTQQVRGIKTNVALFEEPEDGRGPILDAINNATKSIHLEVYLLSDKQIVDALLQKRLEGVDVKVMLEEHPFGGGNINPRTKKTLESGNIQVKWTNPSYALTHEKAIIIDGSEALILNQNLTASSFGKNREFDIIDDNPTDAAEVEKMFESDWQRQSFTPIDSDLVISPVNSRGKLESLINNASKTIDIEMEIIQDPEIEQILAEKTKTDQIRIIIPDLKKIPSNAALAHKLQTTGVMIRELKSPYIHAKLLISDDSKAYIGSVNFSTQSMDENRELGIVIEESGVIQTLNNSFESDWGKAVELQ